MKMVLRVPSVCKNCKSCILQTVSRIKGVKSLEYDEEKSTLTVVGDVDVVAVVCALRKAKHPAEVVTAGDEKVAAEKKKKEEEEKKKKEEEEKKKKAKEAEEKKWKECGEMMQQCGKVCGRPGPYYIAVDDQPSGPCTIM